MEQKTIIYIIFIVGVCVLSFSGGLITGIMQGRDLRTYCVETLTKCMNNSVSSEDSNNKIVSWYNQQNITMNVSQGVTN